QELSDRGHAQAAEMLRWKEGLRCEGMDEIRESFDGKLSLREGLVPGEGERGGDVVGDRVTGPRLKGVEVLPELPRAIGFGKKIPRGSDLEEHRLLAHGNLGRE